MQGCCIPGVLPGVPHSGVYGYIPPVPGYIPSVPGVTVSALACGRCCHDEQKKLWAQSFFLSLGSGALDLFLT